MKEKTESRTIYVCETCGKESQFQEKIEMCELQHSCKHERTTNGMISDIPTGVIFYEQCINCDKELKFFKSEDFDQSDITAIFSILKLTLEQRLKKEVYHD